MALSSNRVTPLVSWESQAAMSTSRPATPEPTTAAPRTLSRSRSLLKKRSSQEVLSLLKKASFTKKHNLNPVTEEDPIAATLASLREMQSRGEHWWRWTTQYAELQLPLAEDVALEDLVRAINHSNGIRDSSNVLVFWDPEGEREEETRDFFRCDIHAVDGQDYAAAMWKLRRVVREAGGMVCAEIEYVGGFLYSMPASLLNPLDTTLRTLQGGHIVVTRWTTPFEPPRLHPLRMHPPGAFGQPPQPCLQSISRKPADPKIKIQNWILRQREKAEREERKHGRSALPRAVSEIVLGPRILDPGVELAILRPEMVGARLSGASYGMFRSEMRASCAEKEVYIESEDDDDGWEVESDGFSVESGPYNGVPGTAVGISVARYNQALSFGAEMRHVETLYRNWMSHRRGL